jgi:hypothetical protein
MTRHLVNDRRNRAAADSSRARRPRPRIASCDLGEVMGVCWGSGEGPAGLRRKRTG